MLDCLTLRVVSGSCKCVHNKRGINLYTYYNEYNGVCITFVRGLKQSVTQWILRNDLLNKTQIPYLRFLYLPI